MLTWPHGFDKPILFPNLDTTLTGTVQGKKSSDLEEYSARAVDKLAVSGWKYIFRIRINPITRRLSESFTNLPGELELDFLAIRGTDLRPILIDGLISHYYQAWQIAVDEEKTAQINQYMAVYNAAPAVRVKYDEVANQSLADHFFRRLLV